VSRNSREVLDCAPFMEKLPRHHWRVLMNLMQCAGWECWLNSHGKLHRVGDDSSKTFYLVLATWFDDSDTKAGETSDGEEWINDDEDDDYESGYASNIGVFAHAEKFRDKGWKNIRAKG
jgi:hypothetical protein